VVFVGGGVGSPLGIQPACAEQVKANIKAAALIVFRVLLSSRFVEGFPKSPPYPEGAAVLLLITIYRYEEERACLT
jgi:hypothetical protein